MLVTRVFFVKEQKSISREKQECSKKLILTSRTDNDFEWAILMYFSLLCLGIQERKHGRLFYSHKPA